MMMVYVPLLVLQRGHGLFDIIIVALSLLLQILCLLVKIAECLTDTLEFSLSLDPSPALGADIQRDGVEDVLVVVLLGDAAHLLQSENVLERCPLQIVVTHARNINHVRLGLSASGT